MQGNDSTRATAATLTCSQQRRWLDSVKSVFRENRRHLGLSQVLRRGRGLLLRLPSSRLAVNCGHSRIIIIYYYHYLLLFIIIIIIYYYYYYLLLLLLFIITAPELATGCKLSTLPDRRGCSPVFLLLSPIEKNQNEGRDKDYTQRRTQFRHPQTTFLEEKYSKTEFFSFFLGLGDGGCLSWIVF